MVEPFATIDLHRCNQLAVIFAVIADSQVDDRVTRTGQIGLGRTDVAGQVHFGDLQAIRLSVARRDAVTPGGARHRGLPQQGAAVVDADARAFFIGAAEQQGLTGRGPCAQQLAQAVVDSVEMRGRHQGVDALAVLDREVRTGHRVARRIGQVRAHQTECHGATRHTGSGRNHHGVHVGAAHLVHRSHRAVGGREVAGAWRAHHRFVKRDGEADGAGGQVGGSAVGDAGNAGRCGIQHIVGAAGAVAGVARKVGDFEDDAAAARQDGIGPANGGATGHAGDIDPGVAAVHRAVQDVADAQSR
ncbi:unannotated protein [freshwater metagenome]|uniref:Unannotated protein n=1 Tax=freshwater metagenome TaxID=449393 RepID=A0A6J7AJW7_9ZZZZ